MIQFKKVAFYTLGCKLNFSETSTIARLFEDAGFAKVDFEESPDVFIINTCSVTENADKKCKQLVKRAKRINPDSFVCIVGCFAQLKPEEIAKMPGVDMVLGANDKFDILEHLAKWEKEKPGHTVVSFAPIKETKTFVPAFSAGDRTRSFLKIQDGCDYFCTFCTIPLARGKSRNGSIADTLNEAEKLAQTEVKEVVLTGVNIGDFGQGKGENFEQLIKELDNLKGIQRMRISSIEPNLLSASIISFVLEESKIFAPHFHIPLQSGSNRLLKAMRRKYQRELYAERVKQIKSINPNTCIGVDVIVGFPGETEEEFQETVDFLLSIDVSYLHVFTYSERANTTAIKLGDPIPMNLRRERSQKLHLLSDRKKRQFYESQKGRTATVLWEAAEENGMMYGFTENYVKVKKAFNENCVNQMEEVHLAEVDRDMVMKIHTLTEA